MLLYVLHAFCYIDLFFRIVDVLADYYQENALCMLFTKCFVYSVSWSPYAKWKGYQLEWWCAGEWISGFCLSLLSVWMKASLRSEVWNACFILFFSFIFQIIALHLYLRGIYFSFVHTSCAHWFILRWAVINSPWYWW